jgi:hypothetical protein
MTERAAINLFELQIVITQHSRPRLPTFSGGAELQQL